MILKTGKHLFLRLNIKPDIKTLVEAKKIWDRVVYLEKQFFQPLYVKTLCHLERPVRIGRSRKIGYSCIYPEVSWVERLLESFCCSLHVVYGYEKNCGIVA